MTVSTRYKMFGAAALSAFVLAVGYGWATPPKGGGKRPPSKQRPPVSKQFGTSSVNVRVGSPNVRVGGPRVGGVKTSLNGPFISGPNPFVGGPVVGAPQTIIGGPKVRGPQVSVAGPKVRGPDVSVGAPVVTVNTGLIGFVGAAGAVAAAGGDTFISAGGGFFAPAPTPTSAVGGLIVEGADEVVTELVTEQVPVTEETCIDQVTQVTALRPVQALCIDDNGVPHPASRLDPSERVDPTYSGEVFRCLAGTHMQVTQGRLVDGQPTFDQAQTFSCRKGEALAHSPGGTLVCAPQKPQRECNERSLLRRHRTGIKLIETSAQQTTCVPTTRTVLRTVQREVQSVRKAPAGNIVLDGGVGQGAF